MARAPIDAGSKDTVDNHESLTFQAHGADKIELPSSEFISDAKMTRDGNDLVLETPNGETAVIEGYFSADPAPLLQSPDGGALTPNLVDAFSRSPLEFAANGTANDQSPVGAVEEIKGSATVTRADGTVETVTIGTPIYQGDVIETDASGAVNITFIDETSMAVSENARLAIDEYSYDPATESGTTNFSVLRGLFVFTSGLIGRDDPDDVMINTPVGSIGIRGTIIAGDINPGGESKITVLEGAIVVKNGLSETTLSQQFETVHLNGYDQPMGTIGVVTASEISGRFESIGNVSPSLFTIINDAVREQSSQPVQQHQPVAPDSPSEQPAQQKSDSAPTHENAPIPQAIPQDILSLNGNTNGLPSMDTALGQTSTSIAGNATGTTNIFNPPATTSPVTTPAPSNTPVPFVETAATPTPTVPTAPLPPSFTLATTAASISDLATAGALIATITPSLPSAGTTYKFANTGSSVSSDGFYEVVGTSSGAELRLTTAGANYFAASLETRPLAAYDITATSSDGKTASVSGSIHVSDSSGANVIDLDSPASHNVSVITDSNAYGMGYSITALGDINQDGFDDFAFTNNINGQNYVYIAHGGASGLQSGDWDQSGSNIAQKSLPTSASGDSSETQIAGIGFFDGDDVPDYIIGQAHNNIGASNNGNIAIVSGDGSSNSIILSYGGAGGAQIGASVSGIGDYNNDGYADVIIGAPGTNKAYLIDGGKPWSPLGLTGSMEIPSSGADGFGATVAGIGDINGDGFLDFAIGAPSAAGGVGSVTIFHGKQSGFTPQSPINGDPTGISFGAKIHGLGDINGDGMSDFIAAGENGKGSIYFGSTSGTPTTTTFNFQNYTLSDGGTAGDFNGDGYDDFTISLSGATHKTTYVVFGKDSMPGVIDLNYLKDGNNALELKYSGALNGEDLELKTIGDINGDGYDDLAIGVSDANGAATGNGGIMVVYGRDTGTHTIKTIIGTTGDDSALSDNNIAGVSIRGGAGDDTFQIHNTNFLGIDGGSNNAAGDKIQAYGDLDFSGVNYERISGIEKLEFTGTGQKITLTVENLFNLMKTSDNGTFTIGAGAGNTLIIDADTSGNTTSAVQTALNEMGSGATYDGQNGGEHVFSIGGYTLYIDADVTLNVQ